ncbi:interleukin-17 receptor D [Pimephales promelas]|uniref:interleukin-17 receptor D n=1 Tax=Pimephales promelas TaxID=90988 RepID=UPI001955C608|nr:interleukin-17 receptor D [Pimephales promelas]KAG1960922.1 interleukin-17 receptor D [Pimephales promelas]
MRPPTLTLDLLLLVSLSLGAHGESYRPQSCTLECIRLGDPRCEYCRITADDVQISPIIPSSSPFGSCVPWPCQYFLGQETPEVCQHYVHPPQNIHIEFEANKDPTFDTITVSWNPSQYGIAFLRGFQVTLQALGGSQLSCQLFLLGSNLSLTPAHAHRVYYSDPFTNLSLDREYVVTVMALPVPERWEHSYEKKMFFTRTCPEKNGLEECEKDWYPRYVEVHQENQDVYVTFNLAPENFEVRQYFSSCFGGGLRNYTSIKPDFSLNKTHHTYRLQNLQAGTNYTCQIAADVVDAVRKTFVVVVKHSSEETSTSHLTESPSLMVLLSVGILLSATAVLTFIAVYKKRLKKKQVQTKMRPEIIEQYYDKKLCEGQSVLLDKPTRPPRLLICYSSNDGPAHVRVVLQLAAFLQKHMATQVHLDLWEALRIMEEGSLGWHCKNMKDCDFVLVICSRGLHQNQSEDGEPLENTTLVTVSMIGEELCRAKALGQDLSKFMVAIFEYSRESDIPASLGLASRYTLTKDLPLLFSHLHGVALQKPGVYLQVEDILESGYCKLPAGAALQLAIQEAKAQFSEEPTEEEYVGNPIIS